MRLGVVVALPLEARCLLGHGVKPGDSLPINSSTGTELGWVYVSGMGAENARLAAESLLSSGAESLLSWGMAAGLAPDLRSGAMILPSTVITENGSRLTVDNTWHTKITDILTPHMQINTNALADCASVLSSPAEKSALFKKSGAVAADMESAAIGEVARLAGIPFLVIRTIVDDAGTCLPPAAMAAVDMQGNFRLLSWLKSVLRHPAQLLDMLPLALSLRAARLSLMQVALLTTPYLQSSTTTQ